MLSQGVAGFQYEADGNPTPLAGLPLYLAPLKARGVTAAIRRQGDGAAAGLSSDKQ
jgi:hypothetical protein